MQSYRIDKLWLTSMKPRSPHMNIVTYDTYIGSCIAEMCRGKLHDRHCLQSIHAWALLESGICHDAVQQNTGEEPYLMTGMHSIVHIVHELKHATHDSLAAVGMKGETW